jgi:hypothetical protein
MVAREGDFAMRTVRLCLLAAALIAAPLQAQEGPTIAEARASLVGQWEGVHESLDGNAASEAFSWPIAVTIEDAGDGSTLIERVQFEGMDDDGALQLTVTQLDADGATEHASLYSRGSAPEHRNVAISLTAARDATHWTIEGTADLTRDGQALQARYSIVRDGNGLVSTFELDPAGDEPPFGGTRRTLQRVAVEP